MEVSAPRGLQDAIDDRLRTEEKRVAKGQKVYYCDDYYWVVIDVEKKPPAISSIDRATVYRAVAWDKNNDGTWKMVLMPRFNSDPDPPCSWQSRGE